jgi:hypothetical protein
VSTKAEEGTSVGDLEVVGIMTVATQVAAVEGLKVVGITLQDLEMVGMAVVA